jgi:2-aminoadipate transaminase
MRLNFSGVNEDEIREGIRRIGEVVREQVALYGTLTGAAHGTGTPRGVEGRWLQPEPDVELPVPDAELATVLRLPHKRAG